MSFPLKNLSRKQFARNQSRILRVIIAAAMVALVGGGSVSIVIPAHGDTAHRLASTATDASETRLALPGILLAQAGSVGGSVAPPQELTGREGKSISGGESAVKTPAPGGKTAKPPPVRQSQPPAPAKVRAPAANSCRSIVGNWTSTASGQPNDTQFHANGTITRPASKGTWSCEKGQYTVVWRFLGQRGPLRLSEDGKQLIGINDGRVWFERDGGTTRKAEGEGETPKASPTAAQPPPSKRQARFNAFIGESASATYLACVKDMGEREYCSEPQGGCNVRNDQWGAIAVGLLQGVALAATTTHQAASVKAAEKVLERCNALGSKYGISCKIVRTWSEGCGFVTRGRGCVGADCRRNVLAQ